MAGNVFLIALVSGPRSPWSSRSWLQPNTRWQERSRITGIEGWQCLAKKCGISPRPKGYTTKLSVGRRRPQPRIPFAANGEKPQADPDTRTVFYYFIWSGP